MVGYSKHYLSLVQESYQVIWWKLFNASCSSKWANKLGLVELLLFCMPITNGHVERVFSSLKRMKTDLRSSLSENHLDDLLNISVDEPLLQNWDSTSAVRLWWKDKQRRQVGDRTASPCESNAVQSAEENFDLCDWPNIIKFISNTKYLVISFCSECYSFS